MSIATVDRLPKITLRDSLWCCRPAKANAAQPDTVDVSYCANAPGNGGCVCIGHPVQREHSIVRICLCVDGTCDRQQFMILDIIVQYTCRSTVGKLEGKPYTIRRPGRMGDAPFHWQRYHLYAARRCREDVEAGRACTFRIGN